ncbi:hypothetical protein LEP1GSC137_3934 [Leptospira borgpetersenii str. Noumea 25]|nr:hypothetical protein LEP1GSC137_3934 [Leptospira borgpetersenii str. Noumea 25]
MEYSHSIELGSDILLRSLLLENLSIPEMWRMFLNENAAIVSEIFLGMGQIHILIDVSP